VTEPLSTLYQAAVEEDMRRTEHRRRARDNAEPDSEPPPDL
jgi:hypothetical protein